MTASLNPYLFKTAPFTVVVLPYPNTGAPKLMGSMKNPWVISVGHTFKQNLPTIKDPEGDSSTVQTIGALPSFVTFSGTAFEASPGVNDIGSYRIALNLTDNYPNKSLSNVVSLEIIV